MERPEPTPPPGEATIGASSGGEPAAGASPPRATRASSPYAFEGFALESRDGLVFTVKGHVHPPGRTVAYLRYAPDPQGTRRRDGVRYRRLYAFGEQLEELSRHGRDYLVDDPVFGVTLQAVPDEHVRRVHDPRARLRELHEQGPRDDVEAAALAVGDLLARESGLPADCVGLTGSLLFGLHEPASDVDLVVYGAVEGRAVRDALRRLLPDPASPLRLPDASELAALGSAHRLDTPIPAEDFVRLQARKVNESRYAGRSVFVRFVKLPRETQERYGDPRYQAAGAATLQARVTDDRDALFSPCAYRVDAVSALDGEVPPELDELVSFRGRFAEQARTGERIEARGTVERVRWADGRASARLTVGGTRGDYLVSYPC